MRNHLILAGLSCSLLLSVVAHGQTQTHDSLLIAPGDVLHVQVADTPEMEEHTRVTDQGTIPVIGVGSVAVEGFTPGAAADAIRRKLISAQYLNHPEVSVTVEEYATQKVSIIGEVKAPGVYPVTTPRPVLDVLAQAGGLSTEANRHILIERAGDEQHPIPYFVSNNGAEAIRSQVMVNPGDTVVVPRSGIVYILGDVNRPGGFVMSNNESQLSLLEGLALAGGLAKTAKRSHAHLIRKQTGGGYQDTQISIGDLVKGKSQDVALLPGDVLYIPFSYGRNIATGGASGILAATAGASIYALP